MNFLSKVQSWFHKDYLKHFDIALKNINNLETEYEKLSDAELRAKTNFFRQELKNGKNQDDILDNAFATVRESCKRVMGLRLFDVQMQGGYALHKGMIAEMKTGEGKTICAVLPVYLNALDQQGVHVVTVNDYLAQAHAELMSKVYNFLGLSVGYVISTTSFQERKKAYQADITYGTNNEFAFDYLRDNMVFSQAEIVQRKFHFALIDELDYVLIDDGTTPLIVSGPSDVSSSMYTECDAAVRQLKEGDYTIDKRSVFLTYHGTDIIEKFLKKKGLLSVGGLYTVENIELLHRVNQALKAHYVFQAEKDYILRNNQIVIVDEFTGRMTPGRRYSDGLHQALEEKERVPVMKENKTIASITFQNFFRLYPKLAGMTGTAITEKEEFKTLYDLDIVQIDTNLPVIRKDLNDEVYKTHEEKIKAVIQLVKECHARYQPVLLGTTNIAKSEELSQLLKKEGLNHNVLHARYHAQEASIIAEAGAPGAITISARMAGRGTDIQLGGNIEKAIEKALDREGNPTNLLKINAIKEKTRQEIMEKKQQVIEAGGLYVIGTERHESRRIDLQLRGRSGRQGDPGKSKFFLSLEDDLMKMFGGEDIEKWISRLGDMKEGESIQHQWVNYAIAQAQKKVEFRNYDYRKYLLQYDNVINEQRKFIYKQRMDFLKSKNIDIATIDVSEKVIDTMFQRYFQTEETYIQLAENKFARIFNHSIDLKSLYDNYELPYIHQQMKNQGILYIKQKISEIPTDLRNKIQLFILLHCLDKAWQSHLTALVNLMEHIGLRAYGQRNPLNEYKEEAFAMFSEMINNFYENCVFTISRINSNYINQLNQSISSVSNITMQRSNNDMFANTAKNSYCPCGSGKRYKNCHLMQE